MAFDTSLLDEARQRQRAQAEKQRQTLLAAVWRLLDERGPDYGIQQAYLFGSLVVSGRFGPDSDVDIAVEQIDPARFFEAIGEFSTILGRDVDLVELSRCPFAQRIREKGIRWTKTT
ncbi:MAG: nucleotidyltransferase domain-containing protein [Phycisphaerae bacterium]|nr:nucleotidyltransferase domain-containing protein [Phycisphaerae bacterium]